MRRHRASRAHPRRRRPGRLVVAALVFTVLPVAVGVGVTQVDVPSAPQVLAQGVDAVLDTPRARPAPAAGVVLADRRVLTDAAALPARSGEGRRVVYSESRQRVWLVTAAERVVRTYEVSGSVYDNLFPGTYEVFSRSEHAVGIDDSGTMRWFVRFTRGTAGAAIGFHTIPVQDGRPVQTHAQLGTPLSHGCIRQRTADAVALWEFAPLGTTVVVTP